MTDEAAAAGRPSTGLKIVLERTEAPGASAGAALHYAGQVLSAAETLDVTALVAEDGSVAVHVGTTEPAGVAAERQAALAEKVRLLVRTLVRQAKTDDLPPPRRINRWRDA
jgi:hypothetical protein